MGYQHPGANGQWPHLDSLYASTNIDLVSFDNYLPLSDWTTSEQGLDQQNWLQPAPTGAWPPSTSTMSGLGLTGAPTIYSIPYLQANIEGGEKFNWFYDDGERRPGPRPERLGADRLAAARRSARAGAQPLLSEPADPRQQATALVVEQPALCGL
jgi:hypothetical protein